jgi:urocanate hydratase
MDKGAQENKLVVGSQARILYADAEGRVKIASFNQAIAKGDIAIVLGRTITMFPEQTLTGTSNIYDGSRLQPIWLFKT